MLEETTMTAVIGDMALAALAAKCIGNSITTAGTDILAATVGVNAAKAKNGALPAKEQYPTVTPPSFNLLAANP